MTDRTKTEGSVCDRCGKFVSDHKVDSTEETRGVQGRTDTLMVACPACWRTVRHPLVDRSRRIWECPSCGHLSTFSELEAAERQVNQREIRLR